MPRHPYKKKEASNDPLHDSIEIAKLINYLMLGGRKDAAKKIVYGAITELQSVENDGLKTFYKAIGNVSPTLEVKPRRLGGASYLVPTEVRKERKLYLALHWIIDAAKGRSNKEFKSFTAKLVAELIDASKNQGPAIAKKAQTEKLAEQNRAFAHLKW